MMNMRSLFVFLFAALPKVWASVPGPDNNLTFAFFPTNQGDACNSYDISKAITFTTESQPIQMYTCFNMSDIFSQNKSTGFQHSRSLSGEVTFPGGVAWQLHNQELYDPTANYTWTWFKMGSALLEDTDPAGPQLSRWIFYQYTLPNCQQFRPGDDHIGEVSPWSMTDCGTPYEGLCMSTSRPIGSFAINSLDRRTEKEGGCWGWETFENAATRGTKMGSLLVTIAATLLVAL